MNNILENKVCMVTGTSRGIGRCIAETFAREGAIVYANARTEGCLEQWADNFNRNVTGRIIPIYFDISKSDEIKKAILQLKKDKTTLNVLVNNAGIVQNELLGMISIKKTKEMFEVNVFGLLELSQYVAMQFMKRQKQGSIINISSAVGVEGSRGQIAYSASKGAVISITKSMAKELAHDNIRVNAVAPGMIHTERLEVTIKEEYNGHIPEIGMGRLGTPEEVAGACLYLASDLSTYTTGQILEIGGGYETIDRFFYNISFTDNRKS